VALVGVGVLGGQDGGAGGEAMAEGVEEDRCLPVSVRAPVECAELARLMAARRASE
jgi:hypothetical protein